MKTRRWRCPPRTRPVRPTTSPITKPRLNFLVVATAAAGYYLGDDRRRGWRARSAPSPAPRWLPAAPRRINQVYERRTDRLMRADALAAARRRPPRPARGRVFAIVAVAGRPRLAGLGANLLSAAVALATLVTYVGIYTPLKLRTSFCDRRRRRARGAAADDRLGGRHRHAVARGLGALRHRLPVADAALPRHRVAVPRGLRAGRLSAAAGHRARRPQHGAPGARLRARR